MDVCPEVKSVNAQLADAHERAQILFADLYADLEEWSLKSCQLAHQAEVNQENLELIKQEEALLRLEFNVELEENEAAEAVNRRLELEFEQLAFAVESVLGGSPNYELENENETENESEEREKVRGSSWIWKKGFCRSATFAGRKKPPRKPRMMSEMTSEDKGQEE
eukprot:TRINITY_DN7540_c0_g1_i1.p1 TRINITY_DN7540_c0_g1~~TRINITY_DN7540_c0_g1_i1.p1  ORF type:complete len:194 (-),score=53.88 TRINITY_DN7540_c0_g1_i1:128-625(-)